MSVWEWILRPLLFRFPAETVHHLTMQSFAGFCRIPGGRKLVRLAAGKPDPRLALTCMGLRFPSPVGLAAGFDKDARWFSALGALGFGCIECGSVTGQPQPGNPRPRLFRLPADRAIINRMGFNSAGAEEVSRGLRRRWRELEKFQKDHVLAINLGKSKAVPVADAASDYEQSLKLLFPFAGCFVINISSPNTAGLRDLQHRELLGGLVSRITDRLAELERDSGTARRPLLLKIAPDLTDRQIDEISDLALDSPVAGIIATNTTTARSGLKTPAETVRACGEGGLSGHPLHARSVAVVDRVYQRLQGRKAIIGVGGVFDGDDVWRMMQAGANLVQLYTGFVYGGPFTVPRIHRRLLQLADQNGLKQISEITGKTP